MWFNYGSMLAEYIFIKDFRNQKEFSKKTWTDGEWKYHSRENGELYPVYHHTN